MKHILPGLGSLEMRILITTGFIVQWLSWSWISIVVVSITEVYGGYIANKVIVFLTNTTPARCHIHTVNRLPNRGDYGRALIGA